MLRMLNIQKESNVLRLEVFFNFAEIRHCTNEYGSGAMFSFLVFRCQQRVKYTGFSNCSRSFSTSFATFSTKKILSVLHCYTIVCTNHWTARRSLFCLDFMSAHRMRSIGDNLPVCSVRAWPCTSSAAAHFAGAQMRFAQQASARAQFTPLDCDEELSLSIWECVRCALVAVSLTAEQSKRINAIRSHVISGAQMFTI